MWVKFRKTESNEEAMSYSIRMYKLIQKYLYICQGNELTPECQAGCKRYLTTSALSINQGSQEMTRVYFFDMLAMWKPARKDSVSSALLLLDTPRPNLIPWIATTLSKTFSFVLDHLCVLHLPWPGKEPSWRPFCCVHCWSFLFSRLAPLLFEGLPTWVAAGFCSLWFLAVWRKSGPLQQHPGEWHCRIMSLNATREDVM